MLNHDLCAVVSNVIDFEFTAELQLVLGVFQEKFGKNTDRNAFVSSWKIANESSGGYCLSHTKSSTQELRVGDILALQKKGDDEWNICIVRWAMEGEDGQLQAGIFKLGTEAEPVSVKPLQTDKGNVRVEYTAALHISAATSVSKTDGLVAKTPVY